MNAAQVNPNPTSPQDGLSALVDGELDARSLDQLLEVIDAEPGTLSDWHAYQVIGDVLRGSGSVVASRRQGDFLAGVRERLKLEEIPHKQGVQVLAPSVELVKVPAANDTVFRWKMVAGVASLAAVMAVSWSLMGGALPGAGGSSGPQLASSSPAVTLATNPATSPAAAPGATVPVASAVPSAPSNEVVVNTGQGLLIRDARLEELLAEHRQHGGMSALQMPSGFIRGATYDASGR